MSSVKEDTLRSVKWSAVERFSVQGIYFITGILMARQLSPSDYGAISMLGVFLAISNTFIDSGFSSALIRKKGPTDEDFTTVFYFNAMVSILCYVVLFFAAPTIAAFFKIPLLASILRVQAISLIIGALTSVQIAKLTIALDFKSLAKRTLLASIISGVVGITCAYSGLGVWSLVIQNLTNATVSMLFIWHCVKWHPKLLFSKKSFNELFSFGSKLLASSLINTLYNNLNTIVIGKFFTAKDLGEYDKGTSMAILPVSTVNGIIAKVTYPILARLQDDDERMIAVYRKYICIMSMIIFFGCCLLASVGKPLILLLLTTKWEHAIIYLQIFSFSIMFDHISAINLNILLVKGRSDLFLKLEIIKKTISTLILFAAIPFGVLGICISKIIYCQIAIIANTYYTGKLFHLGYWEQIKDYSGFFFLSLFCCIPGFIVAQFTSLNHFFTLIIGIAIGIGLYYFTLRNNPYMVEVKGIIVNKISSLKSKKWLQ